MPPTDSIAELKVAVEAAARALRDGEPTEPAPTLDRPPKADLGDYSSNAAMLLAGPLGDNPRAVAERLRGELEGSLGGDAGSLDRVEVAGPGFVNLFLADAWYRRALAGLLGAGEDLGPAPTATPERILVEFVSANPTGPLHVGGGRGAAYGDAVARLLTAIGHEVEREYYINDAGLPDHQLRPLDRRPDEGRGDPRGRLQGRLRGRAGRRRSPPRGSTPTTCRRSATAASR